MFEELAEKMIKGNQKDWEIEEKDTQRLVARSKRNPAVTNTIYDSAEFLSIVKEVCPDAKSVIRLKVEREAELQKEKFWVIIEHKQKRIKIIFTLMENFKICKPKIRIFEMDENFILRKEVNELKEVYKDFIAYFENKLMDLKEFRMHYLFK